MNRVIFIYDEVITNDGKNFNRNKLPTIGLTGLPETLEKSGSHLVEIQNDLPKPVPPSPVPRDSPRTLQEVYTQVYRRDIDHLEKAVGQLLVAGNVTNVRCQTLLAHLRELETEFYRLHLELQKTLIDKLRLADEEVAGKK